MEYDEENGKGNFYVADKLGSSSRDEMEPTSTLSACSTDIVHAMLQELWASYRSQIPQVLAPTQPINQVLWCQEYLPDDKTELLQVLHVAEQHRASLIID